MSEADQFRHYAREAARSSSQATSENEKQVPWGSRKLGRCCG
jgi:hypothetical protein